MQLPQEDHPSQHNQFKLQDYYEFNNYEQLNEDWQQNSYEKYEHQTEGQKNGQYGQREQYKSQISQKPKEEAFGLNNEQLSKIGDRNQQSEGRRQDNVMKEKKKKNKKKKEIDANKQHKLEYQHPHNIENNKNPHQINNSSATKRTELYRPYLPSQASTEQRAIIKQAQKQRISTTFQLFTEFITKHRVHITSQKAVLYSVCQQINRRKQKKYVWYHIIKQYFTQYQHLAQSFREESYLINQEQKISNNSKYLNIGEELKQASDQLTFLKKQLGNYYNDMNSFIGSRLDRQLELSINNFINQITKAQTTINHKKQAYCQMENQLQKWIKNLSKVFRRGIEGKKQNEDVFIETCKFIRFEKQFRQSLICWGKGLFQLRRALMVHQAKVNQQLQLLLNEFKNAQAHLYSFHPQQFATLVSSHQQISNLTTFSDLCTLADTDYIKYTIEMTARIQLNQIDDKSFEYFIEMPHFEQVTRPPQNILKGMINKEFKLKNRDEVLVNTIAGNLVQYNKQTLQPSNKFIVKNLQATIIAEGIVQFDEVLLGIIFDSHRTLRIPFKNQDTAEELICLLNEKISKISGNVQNSEVMKKL